MGKQAHLYSIVSLTHNCIVYIGQTIDLKSRWSDYRACNKKRMNRQLYFAIKKYGIENFVFIDEGSFITQKEAMIAEIDAIAAARFCGYKLYNVTNGGEGVTGWRHTLESLTKISGTNSVHYGRPSPIAGVAKTKEHAQNIANALRGKSSTKIGKKYGANKCNKHAKCIVCNLKFLAKTTTKKWCKHCFIFTKISKHNNFIML